MDGEILLFKILPDICMTPLNGIHVHAYLITVFVKISAEFVH